MKIINLGSCCIDHVYEVDHFVQPGETLLCHHYDIHPGGKGLNQSIAIARAGESPIHAGKIGSDGLLLKQVLDDSGADTSRLIVDSEAKTGHAIIQVDPGGENSIVLYGGSNRQITAEEIDDTLKDCVERDILVLQNEISGTDFAMNAGFEKGMRIIFNAAPMTVDVLRYPLHQIDMLIINEIEGEALASASEPDTIMATLRGQFPELKLVLTLGSEGVVYSDASQMIRVAAPQVDVLDTTGAGDTFTGYLIAEYARDTPMREALEIACQAAAVSVTRKGAATSIPDRTEVGISPA